MPDRLNVDALERALRTAGLSQAQLAERLDVSREAVSKWFLEKSLPRPDKLLKLALTLRLGVEQLLLSETSSHGPIVFFRKKGARKITEAHIERAIEVGIALKPLVEFLPFAKQLEQPPTLKQPSLDYSYVQTVAEQARLEVGLSTTQVLEFDHLLKHFTARQAVIVPVMWGSKENHENALHIYLPETFTTWVYLNLDSHVHDFKFWMAHELGHVQTPFLDRDMAEDFADALAGAILFPRRLAESAYFDIAQLKRQDRQINHVKDIAREHLISPITVYKEANKFAEATKRPPLRLEPAIYGAAQNLHKEVPTISEHLFDGSAPGAGLYIAACRTAFGSPFFDALRAFVRQKQAPASYVQHVLQIPMADAKEIHQELLHAEEPDPGRQ